MSQSDGESPPVFKLGTYVLGLIFAESARKEDAIRLALVCSFFRDIVRRLPQLFSAVCITTRPQGSRPPGSVFEVHFIHIRSSIGLSVVLERTVNAPLEVMIDFPIDRRDKESEKEHKKEEARSMLTTLCRHSDRWETLVINDVGLFLRDELDWQVLPGAFEKLKRLSLSRDIQPLKESMKHWPPQIHVLYVQPLNEGQLETLSEVPWISGIHDLTLKYDNVTLVTPSIGKLLQACHTLRSLHICGACVKEANLEAITLNSLTRLTLSSHSSHFPLSRLQTPALTSLTINEWVLHGDADPHYPCLKRLSITTDHPSPILNCLPLQLYESLFLNFLDSEYDEGWTKWLTGVKARAVTIHHSRLPETTFISMLEAMSGVLEELELVEVRVGSEFIDLFSKWDPCVRTVREFRFRNQQYQRWIWTPLAGWDFLGM